MFINITINNYFEKKDINRYIYEIIVTYEIRIPGKNFPYYESLHFTMFLKNTLDFQGKIFLNYSFKLQSIQIYNFTTK